MSNRCSRCGAPSITGHLCPGTSVTCSRCGGSTSSGHSCPAIGPSPFEPGHTASPGTGGGPGLVIAPAHRFRMGPDDPSMPHLPQVLRIILDGIAGDRAKVIADADVLARKLEAHGDRLSADWIRRAAHDPGTRVADEVDG